jgi:UDP-glucose 4-epimerase
MEVCHSITTAITTPANDLENLGHGRGYTVKEIIELFKQVNNREFKVNLCPPRKGDIAISVLDNVSRYMKEMYKIDYLLKI